MTGSTSYVCRLQKQPNSDERDGGEAPRTQAKGRPTRRAERRSCGKNVGKDKKAPAKATPAPAPAKKAKAGEKRKTPARDVSNNICIGDLLNHYGASQQVACPTPCRYVHYRDIVQGTSKQVVLQRFQGVAPKLSLTEATIALMTNKNQFGLEVQIGTSAGSYTNSFHSVRHRDSTNNQ